MLKYSSLSAIQSALLAGETTCRALVEHYLSQIEKTRHLNAWVEVWPDEALAEADALDARIAGFRTQGDSPSAKPGRLFGAVVSLKDNICYAGHRVAAASKILEGFTSLYSATAVERMLAEDVIIIGRTNCDQFGMGSSNENSVYGPVHNAIDPQRVSGGSSGGAAVALQTGACLVALGSDTGGSIRQPAAFCGLWGLKPTYGRISRHGLIAYGSSFDQIGFLANNPEDIARFLEVTAGPDEYDSTAGVRNAEYPEGSGRDTEYDRTVQPLKIAYFPEALESAGMDAGVRSVTLNFMENLRAAGHVVEPVYFDLLDFIIPTYYVLTTAEASGNLARYDGIRFGYRSPGAGNLEETYFRSRTEGFSDEVKRRILLGTFVLSSGYYDAYYSKAQQVRRLIQERTLEILGDYDFILMPVTPSVAWRFGEKSDDPVAMYLADIFTVQANLAGVPALAIPAGRHPENGMPVGVQLMAGLWKEADLLAFGGQLNLQLI
jgi:aspartyl-tRNA(Asn)/glutamyl-tRNA(Gln) amidotransferase subunit A